MRLAAPGKAVIFAHGEIIKSVSENALADELIALAKQL